MQNQVNTGWTIFVSLLFLDFKDYTEEVTRITGWQSCKLCVSKSLSGLPATSAQPLPFIKLTLCGAFDFSQPSLWVCKHTGTFAPTQNPTFMLNIPLGNIRFQRNTVPFSQVQAQTSSCTDWRQLCRYNPISEAHGSDLILMYLAKKLLQSSLLTGQHCWACKGCFMGY